MKNLILILVALITFNLQVIDSADKRCKKVKHFRKNCSYSYDYEGIIENGINGISDNTTKIRISAQLSIDYITDCEYALQLRNVNLEESFGVGNRFLSSPQSSKTAEDLQAFLLQFRMEYGLITKIKPALKERQKDILNIKRGILSPLQIDWSKNRENNEIDVSGLCNVKYDIIKNKNGTSSITKIKDLASCKQRTMAHSNIDSDQYEKALSIYEADSRCEYLLKAKPEILQAQCDEFFLMKPFSTSNRAGFFTKIRQKFTLRKSKKKKSQKSIEYPEFYSTSLLFDHKHEENTKSSDVNAVKKLLIQIVKESSIQTQSETANHFTELVFLFRAVDERGFGILLGKLSTCFDSQLCNREIADAYWSYFFEALAQCGSSPCVNILANLVMSKKVPANRVNDLISSLNFIQEPSTTMLNTIMGLHKSTSNPAALLVLGTLMHKLCKHRNVECNDNGPIGNVVRNSEYYLMRLLGNDCSTKDRMKTEQMYHALKAIGNAGRPVRMQDIIMDCIRNAAEMNTSIAAIHALRRMPRTEAVSNFLLETLSDRNIDSEKRMESFLIIMESPTMPEILLAIDMVNDAGETQQLRSFIRSYLLAMAQHKGPNRKRKTELFRKALSAKNITEINVGARTSSKVFSKTFFLDLANVGGSLDGMMMLHPESYIPRTARVAMNAQALGQAVNVIDISARMEGLENAVGKLFGHNGYLSTSFIAKAFNIPNDIPDREDKSRSRRSVEDFINLEKLKNLDDQINLKRPSPQASVSVKIFGNEVRLFSLEDIPFLNGEMDDFNIIQVLYSLTKGSSKTLRRNIMFMEGSYVVPTIVGLPLSFEMNGSAVVSLNLQGKVNAKNLLFGPKSLTLEGSVLPSITTEISGKVGVYSPFSKIGMRFNARTLASSAVKGEINYEDGKELIVNLDAPEKPIDLFNYTHEMFHVVGTNEFRISGSKRKTKLNMCADEVYNSTRIFGVNVCTEMSFPVAFHNTNAPFYPLTGPTNVGFRLKKTDMSLTRYHLSLKKANGLYLLKFGTPGSQNERWNMVNFGITVGNENGIIGATFGNTNQGLMLKYQYDNATHGLQANLVSNITDNEVSISASYTNKTDPATLDMSLTLEFVVFIQDFSLNHRISFVETYEYWGFDWLVDYGMQPISAELKVAYNPQTIFFKWEYGTKSVAVKLQPSFPVIVIDLGINWTPRMLNLTLNMDLLKALITLSANTTKHFYGSRIQWMKKNDAQKLEVKFIKDAENFKWITEADYRNKKKALDSYIMVNNKRYGFRFGFSNAGVIATIEGFPATVQAMWTQDRFSKGFKVLGAVGSHSCHFHFKYKIRADLGSRSICLHSRIARNSSQLCFEMISKGRQKSVKLKLHVPSGKLLAVASHVSNDVNAKIPAMLQREIIDFKTIINDKTVIDANGITDNSQLIAGRRILTSLTFKANFQSFSTDLKLPLPVFQDGKVRTSGWLVITHKGNDKEIKFEIHKNLYASKQTQEDSMEYILKQITGKDVIFYHQKENVRKNLFLKTTIMEHKILNVRNNNVSFYEDSIKLSERHISWNVSFKLMNRSIDADLSNMLSVAPTAMQSVKPVVYLHGVIKKPETNLSSSSAFYPETVNADIMGNNIALTTDLKRRKAVLNISTSFGIASNISVDFLTKNRYIAYLDYLDKVRNIKQLMMIVRKDSITGPWKVMIQHSLLKHLISKLRIQYRDAQKKMRIEFLKLIKKVVGEKSFSKEFKDNLQADISLLTSVNLLSANVTHLFDKASRQWMKTIKTVVEHSIRTNLKNDLKKVLKSSNNKILQVYDEETLQALSSDISKMITSIRSTETQSLLKTGKDFVQKLKAVINKVLINPSVKQELESALRKILTGLNVTKSDQEEMMKSFQRGYSFVIKNPSNLIKFLANVTEMITRKKSQQNTLIISNEIKQLLLLLRSHARKSREPELRVGIDKLLEDFERILREMKFTGKGNLSKVLISILNTLKKTQIPERDLHNVIVGLVDSGLGKTGLPNEIRLALKHFMRSANYSTFYGDVMKYGLQNLNMTMKYEHLIKEMSPDNVVGLIKIATIAVKDKRLGKEVKTVFKKYLVTLDKFDLLSGLLNATLMHINTSQSLAESLRDHLAARNLTGFAREAAKLAFENLKLPKETRSILQKFLLKPVNGKSIMNVISMALNRSQSVKDIFSSFEASNNMAVFLRIIYRNIVKIMKIDPDIENVLFKFSDDLSISKLIEKATKLSTERLISSMNIGYQNNTFLLAKAVVLKYVNELNAFMPSLLQERLSPITDTFKTELKRTNRDELLKNATKVMFRIGERVYSAVNHYVTNAFTADAQKYITASVKGVLEKLFYRNESFSHILKRLITQAKDRMMFMLRLAAQIFPERVEKFKRNYVTKDGFLYRKLLSDYLKTNFSESYYRDKLRHLFSRFGQRVLSEITNATGGFSTGTGFLNMLEFIEGLNFTDGNSVLTSYNKMKNMRYTKWSLPALKHHLKSVLRTIGQYNIGNQTINQHLTPIIKNFRNVLPQIIALNKQFVNINEHFLRNARSKITLAKIQFKQMMERYSDMIKYAFKRWPKLLAFVSDLLMPAFTNVPNIMKQNQIGNRKTKGMSKVEKMFHLLKEVDESGLFTTLEDLGNEKKIASTDKTLQDIMTKIPKSFDQIVRDYISKNLFAYEEILADIQAEITRAVTELDRFLRGKSQQPLHKFIARSSKHGFRYIESLFTNSTFNEKVMKKLQFELRPFANVTVSQATVKMYIEHLFSTVKKAIRSFDQEAVKRWARIAVPNIISNSTSSMANSLIGLLERVDQAKYSMLQNPFFQNPLEYVRQMPKKAMFLLTRKLNAAKPRLIEWFVNFETTLRQKIVLGQYLYKKYLEAAEKILMKSNTDLRQLNYYSLLLKKTNMKGWGKYLFNYTKEIVESFEKINDLFKKHARNEKRTSKMHSYLSKMTRDTRMWLTNAEAMFKSKQKSIIDDFEQPIRQLQNIEDKMTAVWGMLAKNMTQILLKVQLLMNNASERASLLLQQGNKGRKIVDTLLLRNILHLIRNLQANVTVAKNNVAQYVTLVDDTTIVFTFPSRNKRLPPRSQVAGKHVEMKNAMKRSGEHFVQRTDYRAGTFPPEISKVSIANKNLFVVSSVAVQKKREAVGLIQIPWLFVKPMQLYIDMYYDHIVASINNASHWLASMNNNYQLLLSKFGSSLNTEMTLLYKSHVIHPLQKLSISTKIPAPAEKLHTLVQAKSFWKECKRMFVPSTGSAALYGNHLFTFDGNYAYIPEMKSKQPCLYLLARDFKDGNFTFLHKNGQLIIITRDSRIIIDKSKIEVARISEGSILIMKELPIRIGSTTVNRVANTVTVESGSGFTIRCQMEFLLCIFEISGLYHNKTLGLLGTNNMEYSDDLRLPDGSIAVGIVEFLQSWQLSDDRRCQRTDISDFMQSCTTPSSVRCNSLFESKSSYLSKAFSYVNPMPYLHACQRETSRCLSKQEDATAHCPTVTAYVNMASQMGIKVTLPDECVFCRNPNGYRMPNGKVEYYKDQHLVDFVLIVRDSKTLKKAVRNLKIVISKLDVFLKSSRINTRYSLVGFDGVGYRQKPYIQTGNGLIAGDVNALMAALAKLDFMNTIRNDGGLDAIRFASQIGLRPTATKIFLLLDSTAIYTGALKEMIETNNFLRAQGIILNVINRYKFKRNIIGKDSFRKRYHLKIPGGERLRNLAFHTADDYVPMVKESRGAILTIKALMSSNEKWMKALPRSFIEIIKEQIKFDKKYCKSCSCSRQVGGIAMLKCIRTDALNC